MVLFIMPLLSISLYGQNSRIVINQEGQACKGSLVTYTCSTQSKFVFGKFIEPEGGHILSQKRLKNNQYYALIQWSSDFSESSSKVEFVAFKILFRKKIIAVDPFIVNFSPEMSVLNPVIGGSSCVSFNTSSSFTLSGENMENIGNVAWYLDNKLVTNGPDLRTASIPFKDPSKSSGIIKAAISDMCGTNEQSVEFPVNIGPAPVESVKGSRLVCNGTPTRYLVQGALNASSFIWDCPGAEIKPLNGDVTMRNVTLKFDNFSETPYHVTVTPVSCNEDPATAYSFDVSVEQSQDKIWNLEYENGTLATPQTQSLFINTCGERCSDCPVSLNNIRLLS
jgi:hypothetical protein